MRAFILASFASLALETAALRVKSDKKGKNGDRTTGEVGKKVEVVNEGTGDEVKTDDSTNTDNGNGNTTDDVSDKDSESKTATVKSFMDKLKTDKKTKEFHAEIDAKLKAAMEERKKCDEAKDDKDDKKKAVCTDYKAKREDFLDAANAHAATLKLKKLTMDDFHDHVKTELHSQVMAYVFMVLGGVLVCAAIGWYFYASLGVVVYSLAGVGIASLIVGICLFSLYNSVKLIEEYEPERKSTKSS